MQVSSWLAATCVGVAVLVIIFARWISKRNVSTQHEPISLNCMYQQEEPRIDASYETFEQVLNLIGKAYAIDPKRLRPSDKLKTLYGLDSWELDAGTEKLSDWIEQGFGITSFESEPKTISELIVGIEKSRKEQPLLKGSE